MRRFEEKWKGIGFALVAAGLFGASTPLAKSLLPDIAPVLLAGLLYLGSGVGLGTYWLLGRVHRRLRSEEAGRSLEHDSPVPRPIESPNCGKVIELPLVGGLHHHYLRQAA